MSREARTTKRLDDAIDPKTKKLVTKEKKNDMKTTTPQVQTSFGGGLEEKGSRGRPSVV